MSRQLLQAALAHVPVDNPLHTEIAKFLGQPVHVGDTIILQAGSTRADERAEGTEAEGFTLVPYTSKYREYNYEKQEYTGEIKIYEGTHTLFPEAGPTRSYGWDQKAQGIVVAINDRNYLVDIETVGSGMDFGGPPDGAVVTFTRTDAEETPFKAFDLDAQVQTKIAVLEQRIARYKEALDAHAAGKGDEWDSPEHLRGSLLETELKIADLKSGETRPWPKGPVTLFGQPQFRQDEILPMHNGKAAMHLATLDTGWGDCGNVNILFACDDKGVPCTAWFEASCS